MELLEPLIARFLSPPPQHFLLGRKVQGFFLLEKKKTACLKSLHFKAGGGGVLSVEADEKEGTQNLIFGRRLQERCSANEPAGPIFKKVKIKVSQLPWPPSLSPLRPPSTCFICQDFSRNELPWQWREDLKIMPPFHLPKHLSISARPILYNSRINKRTICEQARETASCWGWMFV